MYSYTLRQHNNTLAILCYVHCHSLSQNDSPLPTATTKKTMEGRVAIDEARTPARTATVHAHKCAHFSLPRNAELSVNGVVRCVPGRARRSTAAAWDKRVFIAYGVVQSRACALHHGAGGQKFAPGSGAPHVYQAQRKLHQL